MNLCLEDETLGVHQQVTLTAFDLLATVVAALFSAHTSGLDRLTIHYAGTRLGISLQADSQTFSDSPIDPLPGAVDAPFSEIVIDSRPSRKVVWQKPPLTTTPYDVENGVKDLTPAAGPRPSMPCGTRHAKFGVVPFGIRQV